MISEETYYNLRLFGEGPVGLDGNLSERMSFIIEKKLILPVSGEWVQTGKDDWGLDVKLWGLSPEGEDALSEFENERKKTAQAAEEKRYERLFQIFNSLGSAVFGALAALILSRVF